MLTSRIVKENATRQGEAANSDCFTYHTARGISRRPLFITSRSAAGHHPGTCHDNRLLTAGLELTQSFCGCTD